MRAVGSDIQADEVVLSAGSTVGPAEIGLLATVGAIDIQVTFAGLRLMSTRVLWQIPASSALCLIKGYMSAGA